MDSERLERRTIENFGQEWSKFDQSSCSDSEGLFNDYFAQVNLANLRNATVLDAGCGSGRWAAVIAKYVGTMHLLDASEAALKVAHSNMRLPNARFHLASVYNVPLADSSVDFAYSLGVLHHVNDPVRAMREIGRTLKPGGKFLVYLYYAFDNRPVWFRALWRVSDVLRRVLANSPSALRKAACEVIALVVYLPLARFAKALDSVGSLPASFPLANYRKLSFYTMRTDALDRFGTVLEKRFTQCQIRELLEQSGFTDISFSPKIPHWIALCSKL